MGQAVASAKGQAVARAAHLWVKRLAGGAPGGVEVDDDELVARGAERVQQLRRAADGARVWQLRAALPPPRPVLRLQRRSQRAAGAPGCVARAKVQSRQARRAGSSGRVASLRRTLPRGSSAARRRDGSAARRRAGSAARSAATRCAKNSGRGTPDAPLHSRCRLERQARAVSSAPQRLRAAREPLHDGLTQSQEGARTAQHSRSRGPDRAPGGCRRDARQRASAAAPRSGQQHAQAARVLYARWCVAPKRSALSSRASRGRPRRWRPCRRRGGREARFRDGARCARVTRALCAPERRWPSCLHACFPYAQAASWRPAPARLPCSASVSWASWAPPRALRCCLVRCRVQCTLLALR